MARGIQGNSLGARILLLLGERHPITLRQVALALATREDAVAMEARRLRTQGLVVLEKLGEDTFLALSGAGITYLGLPPKEAERLRARRLPPAPPRDEHDPAFG